MLDSGAGCSIWPKDKFPDTVMDPNKHLMAVNGSKIPTYSTPLIKIQTTKNNIFYWHKVILAPVQEAILGWDWLIKFKLDLNWSNDGKCFLKDTLKNQTIPLKMDSYHKHSLNLALVS